jgi:hypothetical protein
MYCIRFSEFQIECESSERRSYLSQVSQEGVVVFIVGVAVPVCRKEFTG